MEIQAKEENKTNQYLIEDYATVLLSFHLKFKIAGLYYQIGEITRTQGWIIHLSSIISQVPDLLKAVIPFLCSENVPFKIAMNDSIADDLLSGNLGLAKIGKIICIYPPTDNLALFQAKKLIDLTKPFRGPRVLTDICLTNIVYTRYGSFNPITKLDAVGREEKYIYDAEGSLIKDSSAIPFQLPTGAPWPFHELAKPILPQPPNQLNHIYKLVDILKQDPRGNVFKGLYLKSLFQVKPCVIKQGFGNMLSDKAGRDIQDRLIWQNDLYKELSNAVPLPAVYDLFQEDGSTVLIMELIKGNTLLEKLAQINPMSKCWQDLTTAESLQILNYTIAVTQVIDKMHKEGYVHRDIVPVNFLINKKEKIILIDVELAYSLKNNTPNPPFLRGTPGFMSPQQEEEQQPTIHDDIYGLGATLLFAITGIFPVKFNSKNTEELNKSMFFFIGDQELSKLLANSLHPDPELRPTLNSILQGLTNYRRKILANSSRVKNNTDYRDLNNQDLIQIIARSLNGLSKSPIILMNDLWCSKLVTRENSTAPKHKEYTVNPGTAVGLSGVLYVLARIHRAGININCCSKGFIEGWKLLESSYLNRLSELSPGLYRGAAGLALSLAEGIRSHLLQDNEPNRETIRALLSLKNERVDLAHGCAGQGLSILQCKEFLKDEELHTLLDRIVHSLLSIQEKDGSWIVASHIKTWNDEQIFDMGYDDTGIIRFLLDYYTEYPDKDVQNAIAKAIRNIVSNKSYFNHWYNQIGTKNSYELGDGGKGLLLTLIKAYEALQETLHKKIAEDALNKYPSRIIHQNISQNNGLASIGELYLEAWRVFKNDEWKRRAIWIANVYVNTLFKNQDDSGCWIMEQNDPPTADLLAGNSGIIHFLVRCLNSKKIGYRLLQ